MSEQKSNVEKLAEFLGPMTETKNALQEAIAEVRKERADRQKAKAKELIVKAIRLQEEQAEADKKYEAAKRTFNKELGKLMSTLEQMSHGNATEAPSEEPESGNAGSSS